LHVIASIEDLAVIKQTLNHLEHRAESAQPCRIQSGRDYFPPTYTPINAFQSDEHGLYDVLYSSIELTASTDH
jgi:hypothetical protein